MHRVPWTARLINERVMEMAGVNGELLLAVRKRKLLFLGQLLRHDCLEKEVSPERVEVRIPRGRQRLKFGGSLMQDIPGQMTVAGLVSLAQHRKFLRSSVAHVSQDTALQ